MNCSCGHSQELHVNGYCRAQRMVEGVGGQHVPIECGCSCYRSALPEPKQSDQTVEIIYDGREGA